MATVLYATERFLIPVDVVIHKCSDCLADCTVRPSEVGCHIGDPAHYHARNPRTKPVWFDGSLLHRCHLLVMHEGARPSQQKLAAVQRSVYRFHAPDDSAGINNDTFRKLLGPALREYSMLRSKLDHAINLGVPGYPAEGPAPQCACCHDASCRGLQEGHADCSFKIARLNSAVTQGEQGMSYIYE